MVLVSHDFRLIDQVAKEIWVCEKQVRSHFLGQGVRCNRCTAVTGLDATLGLKDTNTQCQP
jgi:ATPase subunit of ABC transporter with duplicated ATPase domains